MACGEIEMMEEITKDRKIKIMVAFVVVSLILISLRGISTGLDLQGGSTVQIKAERPLGQTEMNDVVMILEERLNRYGLKDIKIKPWGDQFIIVGVAGIAPEDLETLIGKPGKLEVRIGNISVFTGDELDRVDPFRYEPGRSTWGVPFVIKDDAAKRFSDVAIQTNFAKVYLYMDEGTSITVRSNKELEGVKESLESIGFSADISSVEGNLTGVVTTILIDKTLEEIGEDDRKKIDDILNQSNVTGVTIHDISYERTGLVDAKEIGESLKAGIASGKVVRELVSETGSGDEGRDEAKSLEVIMRSGALPVKVDIVGSYGVSATLGEGFARSAVIAGIFAFIGVAAFLFLRYKKPAVVVPILITGFSEVAIILGFASAVKWNIDLPAIAGIIAAVGTGVDNQIVIMDGILTEKHKSMRHRINSAFFIILGSYFTLLAAMLALSLVGMSMLIGFAFTTMVGATSGVFITRPAYARMVQHLLVEKRDHKRRLPKRRKKRILKK